MKYPIEEWRLLIDPPGEGTWNMAVDEAILDAVINHKSPPTLRFYAWNPPCLSIGRSQLKSDVDIEALEKFGWDVVRRLTGGKAILHTDELTYSIISHTNDPRFKGGVLESYKNVSEAINKALTNLGIPVEVHNTNIDPGNPGDNQSNPICFEVQSPYEILGNGKKLVGSAQARRKNGVLQHGTFPLTGDITRITQALKYDHPRERLEAGKIMNSRCATAETILGSSLSWSSAVKAFYEAISNSLNVKLIRSGLTSYEHDHTIDLEENKYSSTDWEKMK